MNHIKLEDLSKIKQQLKVLLGEDFFRHEIDSVSFEGLSPYEISKYQSKIHPFVSWWKILGKDIKTSKKQKSITISKDSLRAVHLWMHLKNIEPLNNSCRIFNSIRDRNTFHSGLFEARIASEYKSKNLNIEIIEIGRAHV